MTKHLFKGKPTKAAIACTILAASLSLGTSVLAFSDLSGNPAEDKINALQASGVISGVTQDIFAPNSKVTNAQGIQFIVKAFDMKLDSTSSKASDYFVKVSDDAWYSDAFLIAQQCGLYVEPTIKPTDTMNRAQFAHFMTQALLTKGNFPVTMRYFNISDDSKLPQDTVNSLQTLLNTKIITLGEGDKFRPNDAITRSEAAVFIYNASEFVKKNIPDTPISNPTPSPSYEALVSIEKAVDGVNKVSLTIENLPNPGYSISIDRIEFGKNLNATIYYSVTNPDPDKMYTQVISKSTAVTYLPANYKVVTKYEAPSATITAPFSLQLPYNESTKLVVENPDGLISK